MPSGDFRYLAGSLADDRLRFSTFDGAHAFVFDGKAEPDGFRGSCWLGGTQEGLWHIVLSKQPTDPGEFRPEIPKPRFPLEQLAYSDLDGLERPLADPLFEGRPMILAIGGSWSPNCQDELRMLAELDTQYAAKGLSITSLCFEYSGDFQRDALQVRRMAERNGAKHRMLLGGTAGVGEPAKAFPVLFKFEAFPTTLFINRDGSIAALHRGFSGPATGEAYKAERAAFETRIEALLASPAPSSDATWAALLSSPLRDERDGLFLTVKRDGALGSYEAEELTRFDGPTRQGVVERGEVRVQGALARLGKTLYRYDAGTATFQDPSDFAHRLVNAVRPHLPVLEGQMINDPDDLATKLVSADPRWRAETRFHLTKALRSMQAEPRYDTWRGIDDEDPWAACAAVWSAGQLGRVELCEGIAKLLEQPFAPLRHEAVRALGALGYAKGKELFARMAEHDLDAAVRAIAANPPKPRPPPGPPDGEEKH
jgi:thiol-disulfide isomerase/thioredoxin